METRENTSGPQGKAAVDRRDARQSGFTLIEVVMVIVLLGIVSVAAVSLIYQGARSFEALEASSELRGQGTLAMERISRELRRIRCTTVGNSCTAAATDITSMGAVEIRFVTTDYTGAGFRFDAPSGTIKLRRGSGAGDPEDDLTAEVSAFTLEYLKDDGTAAAATTDVWIINASMTLTRGQDSADFKASVHPRSFR